MSWCGRHGLVDAVQQCSVVEGAQHITYLRVYAHCLQLNALQAKPTLSAGTWWTLGGTNCNLHNMSVENQ